jgi:hypothetical protein
MVVTTVILAIAVLGFGILFLRLHTLPERIAHRSHKLQFEIVAVLGLIALFTHMHIFWIAGLLLALIDLPDFGSSLSRIAGSAEKMAGLKPGEGMVDIPPAGRADIKPPDRTAEAQRDGDGKKGDAAVMPSEVEIVPTNRKEPIHA